MKYTKVQLQRKNTKAFTLVEALVAISILMIAVASPLTIAQKGITAAVLSRDQMTASFLAQDGIEAIKNMRDHTAISSVAGSGTNWLSGLDACLCTGATCNLNTLSAANYCNIDTTTDSNPVKAKGSGDNPLFIMTNNATKSFLKYDVAGAAVPGGYSNNPSKFLRYITIQKSPNNDNPNEALVTVRVSWVSPIGPQNIDIQDFIYNYSENL